MLSDIENAINAAKRVEVLLEGQFGATGKGLHEKLSSVEGALPEDIIKKIRWIATVRNNFAHKENFEFDAMEDLLQAASQIAEFIENKSMNSFSDSLIHEFQSVGSYNIQMCLKFPPSEEEVRSARKKASQEDRELNGRVIFVSGCIIVLLLWMIIENWGFLPFHNISKINLFLWLLTNVGVTISLIGSFFAFTSAVQRGWDSELIHLEEAESLEYIDKIMAIKKCNPIVQQYVQQVGKMGRKLLCDEVDFLEEFHLWKLNNDRAAILKKKAAMLYE